MQRALLFIFLFPFLGLNAQDDYSFVPHERWANYSAMDIRDDAIVMVGFNRQCDVPYVTYLDKTSGIELWSTNANVMYYGLYTDVTIIEDGTIWAAGWRRLADDVSDDHMAILIHLDAQGNVISYREELDDLAYEGNFMFIVPLPNGQFFWNTGQTVHRLNSDGTTDAIWNIDNLPVSLLSATGPESFVISTGNSVIIKEASGDLQEIYISDVHITDLKATEQGIYWTDGLSLFYYDFTTQETTDWFLPPNFVETARLYITENEVQVYSTLFSPHAIATLTPDQSEVLLTAIWETPDRTLLEIMEEGGIYYQLGTDIFESETNFRPFFHGYVRKTIGLPTLEGPDIGVTGVNISVDSVNLTLNDEFYWANVYWSGMIEVTNYGDVPVSRFLLASPVEGGFNCAEGRFFLEVNEPIEPQSSVFVPMVYTSYRPASLDEEGNATINLEFCVFSAAPNRALDREPVNDHFCKSIMIVDTEGGIDSPTPLQLFPNPVTDQLTISWPGAQIERTLLFDETGRLLLQHDGDKSSSAEVSLTTLPAGVYWLQVVTDKEVITKKVIKV